MGRNHSVQITKTSQTQTSNSIQNKQRVIVSYLTNTVHPQTVHGETMAASRFLRATDPSIRRHAHPLTSLSDEVSVSGRQARGKCRADLTHMLSAEYSGVPPQAASCGRGLRGGAGRGPYFGWRLSVWANRGSLISRLVSVSQQHMAEVNQESRQATQ